MKVGIIVITYNLPSEVMILQVEAIRKFCKDDFEINIVDNSSELEFAEALRYHAGILGVNYRKTYASSKNGSQSHAFSANLSYQIYKEDYDILFYLDHDCIPVSVFSCKEILGEKLIAGLGQGSDKPYYWPGLVMWYNDKIDKSLVDFSPLPGKDTGAGFYKIIEKYGKDQCIFFNESYHENQYYKSPTYGHYSMLNNEMFLHFVGGSNWINLSDNGERLNSLINIVREKIGND